MASQFLTLISSSDLVLLCLVNLYNRADAPIIGYLLEFCAVRESKIGYDENGNCNSSGTETENLPKPQKLTWDLTEEVRFLGNIF